MAADPTQLKIVKELNQPGIQFCVVRLPDSNQLIYGSSDGNLYQLDPLADKPQPRRFPAEAGQAASEAGQAASEAGQAASEAGQAPAVDRVAHSGYVTGLALAGQHLVSGGYDGALIWWNRETAEPLRVLSAHERWIRDLTASPDGNLLVSVADDMVARVWDAATGNLVRELRGHEPRTPQHFPSMLYACTISPDGKLLATADRVGHIVVWQLDSGQQLATLEAPEMYTWDPKQRIHSIGGIRSLAFSPDGTLLAAGGIGQIGNIDHLGSPARIEVFDWQKQERTHEFKGDKFKGLVERMEFAADGSWLLAAGGDHGGFIQFLTLSDHKVLKEDKAPAHVHDFVLDAEQQTIYAVGHGKLIVWSLAG